MHNPGVAGQLELRLVTIGCPVKLVQRQIREIADHHEDLKLAALEDGFSEVEAEVRANEQLGDPAVLASQLAAVLRQSCWWGRHPVIGFCVLPPLGFLLAWLLLGLSLAGLSLGLLKVLYGHSFTSADLGAAFSAAPESFPEFFQVLDGMNYVLLAALAALFVWLAQRSALGWKWVLAACSVSAAQGLFNQTALGPHYFSLGYGGPFHWAHASVPLLVGAAMFFRHKRRELQLAALAAPGQGVARIPIPISSGSLKESGLFPRPGTVTPTSVIVVIVLVLLAGLGWRVGARIWERQSRLLAWRTRVWPAERAAAVEQMRAGQARETTHETTINLRSWLNTSLTDSTASPQGIFDNTLAGLPCGTHVFGGVPFDVAGKIQLMGRGFLAWDRNFPAKAWGIAIGRRCRQIYLLHGAGFVGGKGAATGTAIGKLVLHYEDGEMAEIPIVAGRHVLDWWGPIYETGVRVDRRFTAAAGTELAWAGTNPAIGRLQPDNSLRLYRSAFENPRPELKIASLDYVSTLTEAAPFLVGLTVE